MKKVTIELKNRSFDSLVLSIELFNRPQNILRMDSVLFLLHHSFEMLLKSYIFEKKNKIHKKGENETYKFLTCVNILKDEFKILSKDEEIYLKILSGLRDLSTHYYHSLPEEQFYTIVQTGITLFDKIWYELSGKTLSEDLPNRIMPITTKVPENFHIIIDKQFTSFKQILTKSKRKTLDIKSELRSLMVIESNISGEGKQPSEYELEKKIKEVKENDNWNQVFPNISSLKFNTEGTGLNVSIKITKDSDALPVRLVKEGEENVPVLAVKRVNELDFYSFSLNPLSKKLGITSPKCSAIMKELNMLDDNQYFKEIKIGKVSHKRYSQLAFQKLKDEIPNLNIEQIWQKNKPKRKDVFSQNDNA